jgi:hypothetical protein
LSCRANFGTVLRPGEDDRPAGGGGEVGEHREVVVVAHAQHVVVHGLDRGLHRIGLGDGPAEVALHDDVDPRVEVALNSMRWPSRGVRSSRRFTPGREAEVGQVVGLVEDGDLDVVEADVALPDEVLEAPRAGDDDVDAAADRVDLRPLAHAAEDDPAGDASAGGELRERLLDLGDEFAGRSEDEGAGCLAAGPPGVGGEVRDER